MNLKMRAAALLMTLGMTAGMLSGCSAEKSGFDYSEGYDEDGRWTQVTALDYVTLPDYTGIEVPSDVHTVTQEQLDSTLSSLLSGYATKKQVLDRAIEDGDTVNIDYVGSVDGVEFEGGSTGGNGTEVTIGVTQYIDDFLEQLIGHKPGESFDVEVTFPDEYHNNEDLAGKDAVFAVTVNYIVEQVTPELTDDFVQENLKDTYGWSTAQEAMDSIKSDLSWSASAEYLWEQVTSGSQISELPQSMVDYQFNRMLGEYQQMADSYGMTLDEAFSMVGVADEEELRQQYLEDLEANAKDELVLQAIAEDADIHVTEEDVEDYFKTVVHLEDYSAYEQNYGTPYLRRVALNNRVLEYLVDNATFA